MAASAARENRKGKRPMTPEEDATSHATNLAAAAVSGRMLLLVADDGVEVRVSEAGARLSVMLRNMIEDDCAAGPIPVLGVPSDVLALIVQYCEKHGPYCEKQETSSACDRFPFPPFPVELPRTAADIRPVTLVDPNADPHGLKAFDKKFFSVDNSTLFGIVLASNYLEIENLLDDACTAVADRMRGKSPEEIREIFDIKNDYTPEQEAEVRRENAWAFED